MKECCEQKWYLIFFANSFLFSQLSGTPKNIESVPDVMIRIVLDWLQELQHMAIRGRKDWSIRKELHSVIVSQWMILAKEI
jgi:hypothetical protein